MAPFGPQVTAVLGLSVSRIMPKKANCIGGRSEPPANTGGDQLTPWIVGKGGRVALEMAQWAIIPDESVHPWKGLTGHGSGDRVWIDVPPNG